MKLPGLLPPPVLVAGLAWAVLAFVGRVDAASTAAPHQYFFDTVTQRLELPRAEVLVALQTRDGYLWVGTSGGLARFDGVRFVTLGTPQIPAFTEIHCLLEDRAGDLWVGTEYGIVRYRNGTFETIGAETFDVRALAEDHTGRIWIGTAGQGLYAYEKSKLQRIDPEGEVLGAFVTELLVESTGRLWIATNQLNGLSYLENGHLHRYPSDTKPWDEIQSIAESPRGTLWFGSRREGLFRLRNGKLDSFAPHDGLADRQILDLRPAKDGGLWVITNAIQKVAAGNDFKIETAVGPLADGPTTICEDHEDGLWICARTAGLIHARQLPIRLISAADGLPGDTSRSVTTDRDGNTWVSIPRVGVAKIDLSGRVTTLGDAPEFPSRNPGRILGARDGSVWIGFPQGLVRLQGETRELFRTLPNVGNISIPNIGGIFESRNGTLWFGGANGKVWQHAEHEFRRVDLNVGALASTVGSFAETSDGTMYVGTWNDGLIRYTSKSSALIDHNSGLPSNEVRAICVDHTGHVWVGFRNRGLAVLNNGRWFNPDELVEAVAGQVNTITEDDRGKLWLGTQAGIRCADRAELLAAALGQRPLPRLVSINASDNLATTVFAGGATLAATDGSRHLLFATRRGVLVVDPDHMPGRVAPPPVQIEQVTVDRHPLSLAAPVVIPAGAREIVIDYTALTFVQPNLAEFKYRLEGYDIDWVQAGSRRTATYTHLAPGDYSFRVIAANSDGVWNTRGATLALFVESYVWQRWWFAVLVGALFCALTAALVRYVSFRRLRAQLHTTAQQAALDKERARIARDIHDDIGNRLTTISLLSGFVSRHRSQPEKAGQYAAEIDTTVRELTDSLDEIVWAVNPRNDTLPQFVDYVGQFSAQFLRTAGLQKEINLPDEPPPWPIAPDVRHGLFLAVEEALTNIVRHARATKVVVSVSLKKFELEIIVADDGRGLDDGRTSIGQDGLTNMRERMRELGGKLTIESAPAIGTRLTLSLVLSPGSPTGLASVS